MKSLKRDSLNKLMSDVTSCMWQQSAEVKEEHEVVQQLT